MLIDIKEKDQKILEPKAAADILRSILLLENEVDQDKEHLWVIGLNARSVVMYIELVSLGILNSTLIHPREIFRMAILKAANSILVGHNHPSDDYEASNNDIENTARLKEAGKVLGINLVDHIIIANNNPGYVSLKNEIWDKEENKKVYPKNFVHFDITPKFKNKEVERAIKSDKKMQTTLKEMKEAMSEWLTF